MAQYDKKNKKYVDRNNDLYDVVMISDQIGNLMNPDIINKINISAGNIPGLSYKNIIGVVPSMSQNSSGSIWDVNDTYYPFDAFGSGNNLNISTTVNGVTSTLDNDKTIIIHGLDINYEEIIEEIIISGSTAITVNKFIRVNKCYVYNNLTDVLVQINGITIQKIIIGKGTSLSGTYTVPAGYTAFCTLGVATCSTTSDATVDMFIRPFGNGFINSHSFEVSGSGGQYIYNFSLPLKIDEKSDLDVIAHVRTNKARITTTYDLILVKNI